jgi:hypothetical protein
MADELEQQEIEENNTVEITQEEKDQEKKIRIEIENCSFISRTSTNYWKVRILMKSNKYASEHSRFKII